MNLFKEFDAIMQEVQFVPKTGKAKTTPCCKCLGLHGCTIKMKRNPDVDCGAFFDKDIPITIHKIHTKKN